MRKRTGLIHVDQAGPVSHARIMTSTITVMIAAIDDQDDDYLAGAT